LEHNMKKYPGINDVIKEIKKKDIDAIYLFGSHATGKVKPTSDIDICVIAKKDITKEDKEEILSNSSKIIDIVMFWDLPNAIRFRVLKEGKPLYVKNRLILQRIKADTLRSYLDFQPVIKRHISRTLGG
jgi:predicted nucleotidyltransferase